MPVCCMQGTMLVLEAERRLHLLSLVLEPEPAFAFIARFKSPGRHSWGNDALEEPVFELAHSQPAYWAPDGSGVLLQAVYKPKCGRDLVEVSAA